MRGFEVDPLGVVAGQHKAVWRISVLQNGAVDSPAGIGDHGWLDRRSVQSVRAVRVIVYEIME